MSAATSQCHQPKDSLVQDRVKHQETYYPLTELSCKPPSLLCPLGSQDKGRTTFFFRQGHVRYTDTNGPAPPAFHSAQGVESSSSLGRSSKYFQSRANTTSPSHRHDALFGPGSGWRAAVSQQKRLWPITGRTCPASGGVLEARGVSWSALHFDEATKGIRKLLLALCLSQHRQTSSSSSFFLRLFLLLQPNLGCGA